MARKMGPKARATRRRSGVLLRAKSKELSGTGGSSDLRIASLKLGGSRFKSKTASRGSGPSKRQKKAIARSKPSVVSTAPLTLARSFKTTRKRRRR